MAPDCRQALGLYLGLLAGAVISPQVPALTSAMIMIGALITLRIGGQQRLAWTFRRRQPLPVPTPS